MRPADLIPSRPGRAGGLLAGAAILVALAGCEVKQGRPDLVNGKRLFVQKCGACHVLQRAGTTGTSGPNLDQAFQAALGSGFNRTTVRGVVEEQILYPRRGSAMPAKLVVGRNAEDVAAYVALVAAKPGKDTGALVLGPTSGPGALFVQQGCGSCHTFAAAQSTGTTGPNLDQSLEGQSAAQIREAIVNPDARIAPGFRPGVMPSDYESKLTPEQLDQLADYLAKMRR
jgi:mono/diheme cytochrome c family protein